MLTTKQIIDLLRYKAVELGHSRSDYAVSKILGVRNTSVTNWTKHGRTMSEENAVKAAELLDLEPEYLIACLNAERAKGTDVYPFWKAICKRIRGRNMIKARQIAA